MAAYSQLHDKEQYCTLNTVCQQRSENCCEKFYSIKDLAQWLDKLDGIVYAWLVYGRAQVQSTLRCQKVLLLNPIWGGGLET